MSHGLPRVITRQLRPSAVSALCIAKTERLIAERGHLPHFLRPTSTSAHAPIFDPSRTQRRLLFMPHRLSGS